MICVCWPGHPICSPGGRLPLVTPMTRGTVCPSVPHCWPMATSPAAKGRPTLPGPPRRCRCCRRSSLCPAWARLRWRRLRTRLRPGSPGAGQERGRPQPATVSMAWCLSKLVRSGPGGDRDERDRLEESADQTGRIKRGDDRSCLTRRDAATVNSTPVESARQVPQGTARWKMRNPAPARSTQRGTYRGVRWFKARQVLFKSSSPRRLADT